MSGALYDGDQQIATATVLSGVTAALQPADVKSVATAASEAPVYVFSNNYTTVYHGQTLNFRYGVGYQLYAALLAFLTAAAAPISAV